MAHWALGCEVVLAGEGRSHSSRDLSGRGFGLAVSRLSEHWRSPAPPELVYLLGVASGSWWAMWGRTEASPPLRRRHWGTVTFQLAQFQAGELPGGGRTARPPLHAEARGVSWKPPATQVSPDFPHLLGGGPGRRGPYPLTVGPCSTSPGCVGAAGWAVKSRGEVSWGVRTGEQRFQGQWSREPGSWGGSGTWAVLG